MSLNPKISSILVLVNEKDPHNPQRHQSLAIKEDRQIRSRENKMSNEFRPLI